MTCINPVLTVDPEGELATLAFVKGQMRVTGDERDAIISELISAAGDFLEGWNGWLGRCIRPQTWRSFASSFEGARLPFPNARAATVSYIDPAGVERALSNSLFSILNRLDNSVILFSTTSPLPAIADREDAVRMDVEYGLDVIPTSVSIATAFLVEYWHDNDQGDQGMPPAVMSLLSPLRVVGV